MVLIFGLMVLTFIIQAVQSSMYSTVTLGKPKLGSVRIALAVLMFGQMAQTPIIQKVQSSIFLKATRGNQRLGMVV